MKFYNVFKLNDIKVIICPDPDASSVLPNIFITTSTTTISTKGGFIWQHYHGIFTLWKLYNNSIEFFFFLIMYVFICYHVITEKHYKIRWKLINNFIGILFFMWFSIKSPKICMFKMIVRLKIIHVSKTLWTIQLNFKYKIKFINCRSTFADWCRSPLI